MTAATALSAWAAIALTASVTVGAVCRHTNATERAPGQAEARVSPQRTASPRGRRNRWTLRCLSGAVLVVVALFVTGAVPGHAAFGRCWTISGYVRDSLMRPLSGATVAADYESWDCPGASSVTDRDGRYQIQTEGNSVGTGAMATASKSGYTSRTHDIESGAFGPPVAGFAGIPSTNDFELSR